MRERGHAIACDDLGELEALCLAAGGGDRAADQQRTEERLDDEPAAELFEHRRDVEAGAPVAAIGLAEQRADAAKLGDLRPVAAAPALMRLHDLVAGLERVLLAQEAAN